ncbi:retinol dehydrogenase 12-like protein [Endogone sp. FLAS-F59071]|nr:retinol dehydrogenase 12-like protein [Endogone sp. FLAS-F59071]|eukprot:RUS14165.1 retinol dehydrogenase 12-like protein [Endogone sp. FLAS-F59071]
MGIFRRLSVSPHDLTGKVAIVTGANVGIGLETARYFAANNATVILGCRNPDKANAAVLDIKTTTGNEKVETWILNLSSFASVREFTSRFLETNKPLDILVNNAGLGGQPKPTKTTDGFEEIYQVNHLSHFLLTNLLLPALKRAPAARVVNVSSSAHHFGKIDLDNLNGEKSYSNYQFYWNTKLINILFTNELARRVKDDGIVVHSLNPGLVASDFGKEFSPTAKRIFKYIASFLGRDTAEGAQTSIYVAVSEEAGKVTGKYWDSCKQSKPTRLGLDKELQKRLWEVSVEAVRL